MLRNAMLEGSNQSLGNALLPVLGVPANMTMQQQQQAELLSQASLHVKVVAGPYQPWTQCISASSQCNSWPAKAGTAAAPPGNL
jgi:hypothetical protein